MKGPPINEHRICWDSSVGWWWVGGGGGQCPFRFDHNSWASYFGTGTASSQPASQPASQPTADTSTAVNNHYSTRRSSPYK